MNETTEKTNKTEQKDAAANVAVSRVVMRGIHAFPVGGYVQEELDARNWSAQFAANNDPERTLWLELICCVPAWFEHEILFEKKDADYLAELFDTSSQMWLKMHETFSNWRKTQDPAVLKMIADSYGA